MTAASKRQLQRCDCEVAMALEYIMRDCTPDLEGALQGYQDWCAERRLIMKEESVNDSNLPDVPKEI